MRLGEWLTAEHKPKNPIQDSDISVKCSKCQTQQTLDESEFSEADGVEYRCKTGCGELLAGLKQAGPGTVQLYSGGNGLEIKVSGGPA